MSPEQWNTYCYKYNEMNGIVQPEQLKRDIEYYRQDGIRRRKDQYAKQQLDEYNASW